jgi:hypothetical protein
MWKLEVANGKGEAEFEQEGVDLFSHSFPVQLEDENLLVPGYTVFGPDGAPIESVGIVPADEKPLELSSEGAVCINGLWLHFDEQTARHEFGYIDERGTLITADELGGQLDDPMLRRQWNLSFHMDGAELLASGMAPGYAGTE